MEKSNILLDNGELAVSQRVGGVVIPLYKNILRLCVSISQV